MSLSSDPGAAPSRFGFAAHIWSQLTPPKNSEVPWLCSSIRLTGRGPEGGREPTERHRQPPPSDIDNALGGRVHTCRS